jgi:hypothetical protein
LLRLAESLATSGHELLQTLRRQFANGVPFAEVADEVLEMDFHHRDRLRLQRPVGVGVDVAVAKLGQ